MSDIVELLAFDRGAERLALRCGVVERVDVSGGRHLVVAKTGSDSRALVAENVRLVSVPADRVLELPPLARASVRDRCEAVVVGPELFLVLSSTGIESCP